MRRRRLWLRLRGERAVQIVGVLRLRISPASREKYFAQDDRD
jgi:hypothetical protein